MQMGVGKGPEKNGKGRFGPMAFFIRVMPLRLENSDTITFLVTDLCSNVASFDLTHAEQDDEGERSQPSLFFLFN
jgi:hypothetical protein